MNLSYKKVLKVIGITFLLAGFFLIGVKTGFAQDSLGGEWDKYLKGTLPGFRNTTNATGEDLTINLVKRFIGILKLLIGTIALIFGLVFGMQMIFSNGKEESLTKAKQNFLWLFFGFVILMVSENLANIFNPESATSDALINFNDATDQLRQIINYLSWLFGSVLALLMTISGLRMITAGGKEETLNKEKTHLIWSGIGMLVVLLARNIVNVIYVINSPDEIIAGNASGFIAEMAGVIRLMLAFLGPIAVAFTIYAGFLYVTGFDNEEQINKAKRLIIAGVTGIIIIYSAFAITNTFLTAPVIPSVNP